ncbi:GNAT family N-acetyltransferase [Sediminicoccus sp. KRV36]|uniref:GNAT family N-acetyltransferase n=1 Tax=Sediminicoccus sp. KRV36 TaxID=3133721 RepID=UPI00200D0713|nr:GNAT family N-acetyltransferase [Sediminicoccus rosea]UPY35475.1 GNAT family N-acetyltransferase [Sediminicoccus rosea]
MNRAAWRIVTIRERPDLVPLVANWLWDAFWHPNGHPLEEVREILRECTAEVGTPQSFVLMAGEVPCGTASFVAADLEIRNEIGPWLAGVYVVPEARGQGCAQRLIETVEDAARDAGHNALFLYTHDAQKLYAALGWYVIEETVDAHRPVSIMRRDL